MNDIETTKLTASTATANSGPLVLGKTGEWWDGALLVSLAVAAIAAGVVFATTGGSVIAHKRESDTSDRELQKYKAENERRLSASQQRIAELGKDSSELSAQAEASKAEIAKANAQAAEAKLALERFKAPRQILDTDRGRFISMVSPYKGKDVAMYVLGEGFEPSQIAQSIQALFVQSGIKSHIWNWSGAGALVGIVVFFRPNDADASRTALGLTNALNNAHVTAQAAEWPGPKWEEFGGMLNGPETPAPAAAPIRIVVGSKPQ